MKVVITAFIINNIFNSERIQFSLVPGTIYCFDLYSIFNYLNCILNLNCLTLCHAKYRNLW